MVTFLLRAEIPSNTGTSSHFYPQHRKDYACGKNSPGAPVFFGISALTTKSYHIIWVYFYPQHRKDYACSKNSPGAPVFFGLSALTTKSYRIFWVKAEIGIWLNMYAEV